MTISTVVAPQAAADPGPIEPTTVTADALPTAQIDGVAWVQRVSGSTVYVGGQFANARPAGAAPGTQLAPRNNLMSYNINTGVMTNWAPNLNGQVKAMALSPDGSRLYVGGSFTTVNGVTRSRLAAFNTATGALITTFASPSINSTVNSIYATNTNVYIGGVFGTVGGQTRNRLAAFSASNGALLGWAPTADATVNAIVPTTDGGLVVGGAFQNINGASSYGLGKVSLVDGTKLPWDPSAAGHTVANAGSTSSILSLSTDGNAIYGTGYHFGAGGNLEGTFSADPVTGTLNWMTNCHGDTYDAAAVAGAVYTVSHAHYCTPVGGFPQSDPWAINMRRALAFTTNATGTNSHDEWGYYDWYGAPSPSVINWFPVLAAGTYTGKTQAAWSVSGNSNYVVLGGEFPTVNGDAQQGLVRFAVRSIAPNKEGPEYSGSNFTPSVIALPGGARVSWQANSDKDDNELTYRVTRDNVLVYETKAKSTFWNRPTMGFIDKNLTPGATYRYRLSALDSSGNTVQGNLVTYTASSASTSPYSERVLADGAAPYWPMNESSGSVLFDNGGFTDADAGTGISRGIAGAISGDSATGFDGSTSAATRTAQTGPNTFTAQAWINTTTTSGGKIIGFGSNQTGNSGSYDRHVYMDNAGRIFFGVYPNGVRTLNSNPGYNDGQWHQITATLGPDGMKLYIDGKLVGQRADTTWGQGFTGYWRVGGDNIGGWPNQPASNYFNGAIDEVAIYPTVLSRSTIDAQWVASGRSSTIPAAPADAYGAAVFNDNPLLYWRLGESAGTTAADAGPNGDQTGLYQNGVTLGQVGGIKGTANTAAAFDGNDDFVASSNSFSNPMNYTIEAWFKTTSTNGGKIIGFGCSQSGTSGCYDRHIYLSNDGRATFGVWTGFTNTISTPQAVNDGQWHHIVGTQSSTDGMKLYLDGALVGTNGQISAQDYSGYWRVGGDNHWGCCSPFLSATIDDAAVYGSVLSPQQVANHFALGSTVEPPNQAPVASFTSQATNLSVTFDGTGSSDSDGTVATYAWDFGDGAAGVGPNPSHSYATAGTYNVGLVVTDDDGAQSALLTKSVTVTAPPVNQPPVASFVATPVQLTVNLDASASSDSDGSVVSWTWNFGDGTTGSGQTTQHVYTTAGTKSISLTVKDDDGAEHTSTQNVQVTAPPPNVAPTASFDVSTDGLTANVASTSTDSDGTIVSYLWDFGGGSTSTDSTAVHTYAVSGTYPVSLTVTDDDGASTTTSKQVTVTAPPPVNAAPVANFTATVNGLQVAFDGTGSTDSDGTISAYSWSFGDTTNDPVTTATASHTYAVGGTYTVELTVTDDDGATATTSKQVTVTAPVPQALVNDTFTRTLASGWGTADTGGTWTITGGSSNFSASGGTGKIRMSAPGAGPTATLPAVSVADVDLTVDVALDKAPSGGGTYFSTAVRKVGSSEYRVTSKFLSGGSVQLQLVKIVNGTSTALQTATVAGLTYAANDVVTVRFQAVGTGPVNLNAKVWKAGTTEPAAWQVSAVDQANPLSTTGGVALYPYLTGSTTTGAVVATIDNLKVVAVAP
ncbi:PKD domain-containing protein [Nakamurella sp.]|uniref:PKD domain-containing protein n=1 Tax=Nakamurella sp. TaxID=1869182 RepID=UPI003B3B36B5